MNPLHRERVVTSRGDVLAPDPRSDDLVPPESSSRPVTYTERGGPTGDPWVDARPAIFTLDEGHRLAEWWNEIQSGFIESPRAAVAQADELLGDLIQRVLEALTQERVSLHEAAQDAQLSTEDLRLALRRYRALLDRLLAL